jgi:hypothetical protein
MRKNEITRALGILMTEAEQLKANGSQEEVGKGSTPFTVAVAKNHVSTITLKRELASIVRLETQTEQASA